jgi:hypothetical protein
VSSWSEAGRLEKPWLFVPGRRISRRLGGDHGARPSAHRIASRAVVALPTLFQFTLSSEPSLAALSTSCTSLDHFPTQYTRSCRSSLSIARATPTSTDSPNRFHEHAGPPAIARQPPRCRPLTRADFLATTSRTSRTLSHISTTQYHSNRNRYTSNTSSRTYNTQASAAGTRPTT